MQPISSSNVIQHSESIAASSQGQSYGNDSSTASSIQTVVTVVYKGIAESINSLDLARFIEALQGNRGTNPEQLYKLNACLVERLQEDSSSPWMKRLGDIGRKVLFSRLVNTGNASTFVSELNYMKMGVNAPLFIEFTRKCFNISKLYFGNLDFSPTKTPAGKEIRGGEHLISYLNLFKNLQCFGYRNLTRLEKIVSSFSGEKQQYFQMLFNRACIEMAAGRVELAETPTCRSLFLSALTKNPEIAQDVREIDIYAKGQHSQLAHMFNDIDATEAVKCINKIIRSCTNLIKLNLGNFWLVEYQIDHFPKTLREFRSQYLLNRHTMVQFLPETLTRLDLSLDWIPDDSTNIFKRFTALTDLRLVVHSFFEVGTTFANLPASLRRFSFFRNWVHYEHYDVPSNIISSLPAGLEELDINHRGLRFESKDLPRSLRSFSVRLDFTIDEMPILEGNWVEKLFKPTSQEYQWPENLTHLKIDVNQRVFKGNDGTWKFPKTVKNLNLSIYDRDFALETVPEFPEALEVLNVFWSAANSRMLTFGPEDLGQLKKLRLPSTVHTAILRFQGLNPQQLLEGGSERLVTRLERVNVLPNEMKIKI